jgi:hypothetical protein
MYHRPPESLPGFPARRNIERRRGRPADTVADENEVRVARPLFPRAAGYWEKR